MKTVVITGANRGIGLAFVKYYLAQGEKVIALCRQPSAELSATTAEILAGVDVTSSDVGATLSDKLRGRDIDLLINNAGILRDEKLGALDFASLDVQFAVNAVGPLRVSEALLGNMSEGSKIAFITSRMGSLADNSSGGRYGYRMSKAALNMAGVSLARDVKARGIAVAILHPGYVQTAMVNFGGDISAEVAAQRLAARIDELNLDNSGTFWHSNGEELPW